MAARHPVSPPESESHLLQRAHALAGHSLAELAERHGFTLPSSPRQAKGWTGQLLERCLGASAGSRPEPDFPAIGVELKTLPLNRHWQPKESTYVCTVPMQDNRQLDWQSSWVCQKLQRVLWLPIEADPALPLAQRRVGTGILWTPSPVQAAILQQDWQELMDMVALGRWTEISAEQGQYLQIRPKAAHGRSLCKALDESGQTIQTLPRGFYLRTRLTREILDNHYA